MAKVSRWIRLIIISSTATQAIIYLLRPMITYRALELDASPTAVGVIASIYALLPVLLALKFGRWVGEIGEGKFIILGTLGLGISSAALFFSHSILLLAIAAAISGVAHLACMVGGQTMVSLKSDKDSYEKNFGYYTFSASLGQMIGPIVGAIAAGSTGVMPKSTASAFVVGIIASGLAVIPVIGWRNNAPTVIAHHGDKGALRSAGKLLRNPKIFAPIYTSLAISSVGDILLVFLPLYGKEQSFSTYAIGIVLAIRAGASMVSRFFLGKLSQRYSTRQLLVTTNIISIVTCGFMGFAPNTLTLGAIVLIAGLSLGVGQPLTMSMVSLATAPEERALAVSARLTGNRFGQFIVPTLAGVVASASGVRGVFISLSALLATTFIPRH